MVSGTGGKLVSVGTIVDVAVAGAAEGVEVPGIRVEQELTNIAKMAIVVKNRDLVTMGNDYTIPALGKALEE